MCCCEKLKRITPGIYRVSVKGGVVHMESSAGGITDADIETIVYNEGIPTPSRDIDNSYVDAIGARMYRGIPVGDAEGK